MNETSLKFLEKITVICNSFEFQANLTENDAKNTFTASCKVAIECAIAMDMLVSNNQCEY